LWPGYITLAAFTEQLVTRRLSTSDGVQGLNTKNTQTTCFHALSISSTICLPFMIENSIPLFITNCPFYEQISAYLKHGG